MWSSSCMLENTTVACQSPNGNVLQKPDASPLYQTQALDIFGHHIAFFLAVANIENAKKGVGGGVYCIILYSLMYPHFLCRLDVVLNCRAEF